MGFQDRLKELRQQRVQAEEAAVDAAEKAKAAKHQRARSAAQRLLPEVREAVEALRSNRDASEKRLMGDRDPTHRGNWGLGPMVTVRREREQWRWGHGRPVRVHHDFVGWWVRREPFEFEIPLVGEPRVGVFQTMNYWFGPKTTLGPFAEQAVYDYLAGSGLEGGPSEPRQGTADQAFADLLEQVMNHLVAL